MKTRSIKWSAVLAICLGPLALSPAQDDQAGVAQRGELTISEVRNYRQMFRVNDKPIDMAEATKTACAPPALMHGPHYDPGVVYYINEIARRAITTYAETRRFPVGSLIVKEKQERRTEDSVEIITVMKKVLSESSEAAWEYKMYDTKRWVEVDFKQGVTPSNKTCVECHPWVCRFTPRRLTRLHESYRRPSRRS